MLGNKIRVDKKMLVAGNMKLTDTEAAGSGCFIDVYQQELNLLKQAHPGRHQDLCRAI